jgi:hypothetical protein
MRDIGQLRRNIPTRLRIEQIDGHMLDTRGQLHRFAARKADYLIRRRPGQLGNSGTAHKTGRTHHQYFFILHGIRSSIAIAPTSPQSDVGGLAFLHIEITASYLILLEFDRKKNNRRQQRADNLFADCAAACHSGTDVGDAEFSCATKMSLADA